MAESARIPVAIRSGALDELFHLEELNMDWSGLIPGLKPKTDEEGGDGFSLFGVVIMMMFIAGSW